MEKSSREMLAGFVAAAAAVLFFGYMANEVVRGETMRFDMAVRGAIHARAFPLLTRAMRGVTQLGSPAFLVTVAAILTWRLVRAGRRHAAIVLILAAIGGEALDEVLKLMFHRPRPQPFFGLAAPESYSFPSGHAVASCCFYLVAAAILSARVRSWTVKAAAWAGAALVAGLIGFSRVYLGVHYPSDVLAGYAAAVIWILAVRAGYQVWLRRVGARAQ